MADPTFIIDCPSCKAKVAAIQKGLANRSYYDEDVGHPYGERLYIGSCPRCKTLLTGRSEQVHFENYDSDEDVWSDVVRVYPKPPRTFSSGRFPKIAKDSLSEAEKSLQATANMAACVMLGRALEAVCNDSLGVSKVTLNEGLKNMKAKGIIDNRLYDWSQQLRAFRNVAAHAQDVQISREDAEDLQTFVYAIIEYIYDLTDRYNEFQERVQEKEADEKEAAAKAAKKAAAP